MYSVTYYLITIMYHRYSGQITNQQNHCNCTVGMFWLDDKTPKLNGTSIISHYLGAGKHRASARLYFRHSFHFLLINLVELYAFFSTFVRVIWATQSTLKSTMKFSSPQYIHRTCQTLRILILHI